jgi:hypothetical protein
MSERRYGNRPGLILAPVLLVALTLGLLLPATEFGYTLLKVLIVAIALIIVWRWKEYRDRWMVR